MEKEILEEYAKKGLSTSAIAKEENKSKSTIQYWMKKHKIVGITPTQEKYKNLTSEDYNEIGQKRQKANNDKISEHRKNKRKKLLDLYENKCSICGYSKCKSALEFHHLDPSTKEFNLSLVGMTYSWSTILKEAAKCILLCSNCHRELHEFGC